MGRKRANAVQGGSKSKPTGAKSPDANGGGEAEKGVESKAGQRPTKRGDKPQAVQAALERGMQSPTEIANYLREQGIEITPAHVTTIKGKLKREAGGKAKGQGGRKPKQEHPAREQAVQPAARKTAAPSGAGLTPQDLAEIAEIAERVGGVDRLQEFLSALKRIR